MTAEVHVLRPTERTLDDIAVEIRGELQNEQRSNERIRDLLIEAKGKHAWKRGDTFEMWVERANLGFGFRQAKRRIQGFTSGKEAPGGVTKEAPRGPNLLQSEGTPYGTEPEASLSDFEHEGMTCEAVEVPAMRIPPAVKKAVERLSTIADKRIQLALLEVLYMEPGDRNQVCYILENMWISHDDTSKDQTPTPGTGA